MSSILQLADFLKQCVELEANPENARVRFDVLSQIEALHRSLRRPGWTPYVDYADTARLNCAGALLRNGVIQAMPKTGFVSAKYLAEHSPLEEAIIIRLMRHLTCHGYIALGPELEPTYAHTHLSQQWLAVGGPEFTLMMVEVSRPELGLYFKDHDAAAVEDPLRCPGSWHYRGEGEDWFAAISKDKDRIAIFDRAMQFAEDIFPVFGMYPFEQLVKSDFPADKPLLVDVGGGRGQATLAIKKAVPGLKGRLIVQDRPEVVASVDKAELGDIEAVAHDFFTPQPIKGAPAYYIRRVLHDWHDEGIVQILKHTAEAMLAESRLLIQDLLLPERAVPGVDMTPIWMDFVVMVVGGRERTEQEYIALMNKAGLEHVKTWKAEVSSYAVIEAKRKDPPDADTKGLPLEETKGAPQTETKDLPKAETNGLEGTEKQPETETKTLPKTEADGMEGTETKGVPVTEA